MTLTRRPRTTMLLACALGLLLAFTAVPAHAGPGDRATGFGERGHRSLGTGYDVELTRIAGGRIVTVQAGIEGGVKVQQVTPGGRRVKAFGGNGVRTLGAGTFYGNLSVTWMGARKLVVVAGHYQDVGGQFVRLWALKPNGSLAKKFGDGGTVAHGPGFWNDVEAQGKKLLVIGAHQVARLNPDGRTFDASFNGGAGIVDRGDPGLVLRQILPHRKGFFVSGASNEGIEVFKLTRDGRLVTRWGDGSGNSTWAAPAPAGYTVVGYADGYMDVRNRRGKIVYAGTVRATYPGTQGEYQFNVIGALKADGYLDEKFQNGQRSAYRWTGPPVAVGKGRTLVPATSYTDRSHPTLVRLNTKGGLDKRFGRKGLFRSRTKDFNDMVRVLPPRGGVVVGAETGYRKNAVAGLIGIQG